MNKIFTYAVMATSIVPVFFVATTTTANAQDACVPTTADFATLQQIQNNPNLTQSQELGQELALRQQLLGETISCATDDAQALKATLASVTPTGASAATVASVQSQLSGKIDDALNFYAIESAKVNNAGISATEAIAREMIAWRSANYVPLEGSVNNFVIWSKNQSLFETAQSRLTQSGEVVSFIENAATTNGDLETSLQAAQSSFGTAQDENAAVGVALVQSQQPDATLVLIQQSLQSLAVTYQKFGDLNALIQKVLPTAN